MRLNALGLEMPRMRGRHPNRAPFHGVLTLVDVPSDRSPSGARGRRVVLTRQAAEAALPSLVGMGLDYTPGFDGHDARRKIGIITEAEIVGRELRIQGYLFARDFPEIVREVRSQSQGALGMSYELAEAHVEDVSAPVWKLVQVTFTGAAVLLRAKAAYGATWIRSGEQDLQKPSWRNQAMNEAQMQELVTTTQRMAEAADALRATIERVDAQHDELAARIDRIVAAIEGDAAETEALRQKIAELEAANSELRAGVASAERERNQALRKTLPPLTTALLAKNGVDLKDEMDHAALDAALAPLSTEQRIAVKAQMARAGLIG